MRALMLLMAACATAFRKIETVGEATFGSTTERWIKVGRGEAFWCGMFFYGDVASLAGRITNRDKGLLVASPALVGQTSMRR